MNNFIVFFAGPIASGKTTISLALADRLKWKRIGFGRYVTKVAEARGLEQSRPVLQNLGEELVTQDPESFCHEIVKYAEWKSGEPLILDGLRHSEVLAKFREIFRPTPAYVVYVDIDEQERRKRLLERGLNDSEDNHSTEKQVRSTIKDSADLVVDGTAPQDSTVQQVVLWLESIVAH